MIVAIGGCSRAGKTTLAEKLMWECRLRNHQAISIHLDDFVKKLSEIPRHNNEPDWEHPAIVDVALITHTLQSIKDRFSVIFLEGHLVYAIAELMPFYKKQILIEIPEEIFFERRKRDYRWGIPEEAQLPYIWQSWQKYGKTYLNISHASFIPGNQNFNIEQIYQSLNLD
jgi:nicotinamide/nicotinate riboside kinase